MNYLQGFSTGLSGYGQAIRFITRHKLGGYVIFPLVINVLLFLAGFFSVSHYTNQFIDAINHWVGMDGWTFWGAGVLSQIIYWFIWIVLRILFFLGYVYIGGYIILILLSPVFAILSERVETLATGQNIPFSLKQFIHDVLRGSILALRNLAFELLLTLALLMLGFIPVVGWLTPFAMIAVTAYFYGFSFCDYTMERRKMDIRDSVRYMRTNKGLALGNGLPFTLLLMVPIIGVSLAGFLSILSVVAATLSTIQHIDSQRQL